MMFYRLYLKIKRVIIMITIVSIAVWLVMISVLLSIIAVSNKVDDLGVDSTAVNVVDYQPRSWYGF